MTAALLPPARAARLIHALFVIQLISMGAMEMSGPFWPVHLKTHSTSALEFGIASVAVYIGPMLGIMLTAAFWGRVGDRFGHKLMMVRALLGLSLTQLALAFATDVWMILALRCIQGACAGYIAPAQTYGVSVESPLRRARLFAYLQVSTNLGSLVGAVAGGLNLDQATCI
jgi:MFS family permease